MVQITEAEAVAGTRARPATTAMANDASARGADEVRWVFSVDGTAGSLAERVSSARR